MKTVKIPVREIRTVREAETIVGRLSEPKKMPGFAWGTPAAYCRRGKKLRKKKGTVCSKCYACKGRYSMRYVFAAYQRRYFAFMSRVREQWIAAMAFLMAFRAACHPYFRIFDSGDLADESMLEAWMEVARRVPAVFFWMATRERATVRRVLEREERPSNLIIRISADMLDAPAPHGFEHTSRVSTMREIGQWSEWVKRNSHEEWYCPSLLQDDRCGDCRACWDEQVKVVVYHQH